MSLPSDDFGPQFVKVTRNVPQRSAALGSSRTPVPVGAIQPALGALGRISLPPAGARPSVSPALAPSGPAKPEPPPGAQDEYPWVPGGMH